jgi:hypothetical protein
VLGRRDRARMAPDALAVVDEETVVQRRRF